MDIELDVLHRLLGCDSVGGLTWQSVRDRVAWMDVDNDRGAFVHLVRTTPSTSSLEFLNTCSRLFSPPYLMDQVRRMEANYVDTQDLASVLAIHHLGQAVTLLLSQGLRFERVFSKLQRSPNSDIHLELVVPCPSPSIAPWSSP